MLTYDCFATLIANRILPSSWSLYTGTTVHNGAICQFSQATQPCEESSYFSSTLLFHSWILSFENNNNSEPIEHSFFFSQMSKKNTLKKKKQEEKDGGEIVGRQKWSVVLWGLKDNVKTPKHLCQLLCNKLEGPNKEVEALSAT